MRQYRGFACAAGLVLLAACSPYGFQQPIARFDASITAIEAAYEPAQAGFLADQEASDRHNFLSRRPRVGLQRTQDCSSYDPPTAATRCLLLQGGALGRAPAPGEIPRPLVRYLHTPDPVAESTFNCGEDAQSGAGGGVAGSGVLVPPLLISPTRALALYTNGLKAVTDASDRERYDAASEQLVAVFRTIGAAIPPYGAALGPVASASFWLVGQGLDYERRRSLEAHVRAACPRVRNIALLIATELEEQRQQRIEALVNLLDAVLARLDARAGLTSTEVIALLTEAQGVARRIDGLRAISSSRVATSVATAHDRLVEAITTGSGDVAETLKALNQLAGHAYAIRASVSSARD